MRAGAQTQNTGCRWPFGLGRTGLQHNKERGGGEQPPRWDKAPAAAWESARRRPERSAGRRDRSWIGSVKLGNRHLPARDRLWGGHLGWVLITVW